MTAPTRLTTGARGCGSAFGVVRRAVLITAMIVTTPGVARAQRQDGMYGRLERDLVLSAEVLGGAAQSRGAWAPAGEVTLRARYLDMAGIALGYRRSFVEGRDDALLVAVELRPAFFARINFNFERGPRWLDLLVDSIGVELGASWIRPGEAHGQGGGVGGVFGLGVELPLHWRDAAEAVMLRLGARWTFASAWDAQGPGGAEDGVQLGLGLVIRAAVRGGVVPSR